MDSLYILVPVIIFALVLFILMNKMAVKGMNKAFYQKKWKEIDGVMASGEMGYKLAVIEADKLLDHALIASGFSGETMGERLKSARASLVNNNDVWEAHKFRNQLVHEQNVKVYCKEGSQFFECI